MGKPTNHQKKRKRFTKKIRQKKNKTKQNGKFPRLGSPS